MQLYVDFDDDLIRRYVDRGSNPIFTIYWTQDGVAYPADQWLDFGSVILSWWLAAAKSLLEGAVEAELDFMDGPFRLKASRAGNLLYVSADDQSWHWRPTMEAFAAELLRAANQVLRKFNDLGISDQEGLQIGSQHLRSALSQAKARAVGSRAVVAERV